MQLLAYRGASGEEDVDQKGPTASQGHTKVGPDEFQDKLSGAPMVWGGLFNLLWDASHAILSAAGT